MVAALAMVARYSPADDAVILNSGEELVGTIEAESAESVTIRYKVTGSILESRTIPREEIRSVRRETPDDAAFAALKDVVPTADLLTATDYQRLLGGPRKFLEEFPESSHKPAVEAMIATLEEEMANVREGRRKFEGSWLTPEDYQRNETNIKGAVALADVRKRAGSGDLLGALRAFDAMEQALAATNAFPAAVTLARETIVPAYLEQLKKLQREVPLRLKEREAAAALPPAERRRAENAIRIEDARWNAIRDQEKKDKVKWRSVSAFNDKDIAEVLKEAEKEVARLAKIDVAALTKAAEYVAQGIAAMSSGDAAGAVALFDRAKASGSVDQRLGDLRREANELAEKGDAERREAERKAAIAARAAAGTPDDARTTPAPPRRESPTPAASDEGGESADDGDNADGASLAIPKTITFPMIVGGLVGLIVLIAAFKAFQQYRFRKTAGSVIERDLSPSALNLDVRAGTKDEDDFDDEFGGDRH